MTNAISPASVAVILGTRPEIIKLAFVVKGLGHSAFIVHSGQHYDDKLSQSFFQSFDLPAPRVSIGVGGTTRGHQIGGAVQSLDAIFDSQRPRAVIVQGDTNTTLAGALAANAREIPLVHVEAGLRSHDRRMPEEHNRVLTDHIADLLCAPTRSAMSNAVNEGISDERISITGNTVIEAVQHLMPDPAARSDLLSRFGLTRGGYVLSTFHRPENVDQPDQLALILDSLARLDLPVILPMHPRTRQRAQELGLDKAFGRLQVVDPIGYVEFLGLGAESAFLVSDSGGLQEEVSVYKRPVIVVRRSTERPEVLGTFARLVAAGDIVRAAADWLSDPASVHEDLLSIPSPYGDGTASDKVLAEVRTRFDI